MMKLKFTCACCHCEETASAPWGLGDDLARERSERNFHELGWVTVEHVDAKVCPRCVERIARAHGALQGERECKLKAVSTES